MLEIVLAPWYSRQSRVTARERLRYPPIPTPISRPRSLPCDTTQHGQSPILHMPNSSFRRLTKPTIRLRPLLPIPIARPSPPDLDPHSSNSRENKGTHALTDGKASGRSRPPLPIR